MRRTSHTTKFHKRRTPILGLTPPDVTEAMKKAAEDFTTEKKPFPGRPKSATTKS